MKPLPVNSKLSQQVALGVMRAVLAAADPSVAIKTHVQIRNNELWVKGNRVVDDLGWFKRTLLLGAGKASCEMASACIQVGLKISEGLVITKTKHGKPDDRAVCESRGVRIAEASHPIPCENGAKATLDVLKLLKESSSPDTLVIWVASGGGSALTGGVGVKPFLDLPALKQSMQWLLDSGADITQVNAIRKHICAAHGGKAALAAGRSRVITLCLSDVIGSPVDAIAGGPTAVDHTTLEDCRRILKKYSSKRPLVEPLQRAFFSSSSDGVEETPKAFPANIEHPFVVADLKLAIEAGAKYCKETFPDVQCVQLTSQVVGEASDVGRLLVSMGSEISLKRPFLLMAGGETTVTMDSSKSGLGGRNQEMGLAAALQMASDPKCSPSLCFLAAGTDGTDGPTNAAGAIVDKHTLRSVEMKEAAVEAMEKHDSYHFFERYAKAAHIITGPTGTNVMDIMLVCDVPGEGSKL